MIFVPGRAHRAGAGAGARARRGDAARDGGGDGRAPALTAPPRTSGCASVPSVAAHPSPLRVPAEAGRGSPGGTPPMSLAHRFIRAVATLALAIVPLAAFAPALRAELPPLVPRDLFFGNPVKAGPAGLAGREAARLPGALAGRHAQRLGPHHRQERRPHGHERHEARHPPVLLRRGRQAPALPAGRGRQRELPPLRRGPRHAGGQGPHPARGRARQGLELDRKHPDEMLVGLNLRDKKFFDMHRISISTGESKLDTENPGDVQGWGTDADFVVRGAQAPEPRRRQHRSCACATTRTPRGATC